MPGEARMPALCRLCLHSGVNAQVVVANRQRAAQLLEAVLPELPKQQAREVEVAGWSTEIREYVLWMRSLKRQAKKEKRQAEQASAVAAVQEHGSGHKKIGRAHV